MLIVLTFVKNTLFGMDARRARPAGTMKRFSFPNILMKTLTIKDE
jgi:hypothetical protein